MRSHPLRSRPTPIQPARLQGPGFYVWDEEATRAEAWAHELALAVPRDKSSRKASPDSPQGNPRKQLI